MKNLFIGQPFTKQTIGAVLAAELEKKTATRFIGVVAWAKASGLSRIGAAISEFGARRKGNVAELYIGIDEGGATYEGLELAIKVCSKAFVFHDRGSRTFHTKLYLIEGKNDATVIIGSGNMTKGGLWTNYEAASVIYLDLNLQDDKDYLVSVHSYIEQLRAARTSCYELSEKVMSELRKGMYNIKSEAMANKTRRLIAQTPSGDSLFGAMKGLATAPAAVLSTAPDDDVDSDTVLETSAMGAQNGTNAVVPEAGWAGLKRSFYKKLSTHDASLTQAPGQIVIPVQFKDFFPPLTLQWDKREVGGSAQSEVKFPAIFRDGKFTKDLAEVRSILYEPANHQARKNSELRFTFHDRDVFRRFSAGDVIVFRTEDGRCVIERHTDGARRPKKFAWIE